MSVNDMNLIAQINDCLSKSSGQCQQDLRELEQYMRGVHTFDYTDDQELNDQFRICAMLGAFLTWATLNQKDFNSIATWWSSEVAQDIVESFKEMKRG